jgi:hypothetical protein
MLDLASDESALQPPMLVGSAPLYFSGEDGLQLTALNAAAGVSLRVAGRFLAARSTHVGVFSRDFTPTTDRTATIWWIPLGEGWVLDVAVMVLTGTPQHGQCWTRLALVRGGPTAGMESSQLTQGYVTRHRYIGRPLGTIEAPLEGPGALRSITGSSPSAGANISEAVPTGARWELLALQTALTTSATVATRVVSLVLDDGAAAFHSLSAQTTQAASFSFNYSAAQGTNGIFSGSDNRLALQLPIGLRLAAGYRIRTAVLNLQVGDQLTAAQMLVREWMTGE